jgi:hypothetical protein
LFCDKKFVFSVNGQGVDIWRVEETNLGAPSRYAEVSLADRFPLELEAGQGLDLLDFVFSQTVKVGFAKVGNATRFSRTRGVTTASPG